MLPKRLRLGWCCKPAACWQRNCPVVIVVGEYIGDDCTRLARCSVSNASVVGRRLAGRNLGALS